MGNALTAATAVADGKLGLFTQVMIGDLVVDVLMGLSAPESLTITRKPVEAGYAATDAAINDPIELYMTIALTDLELSVEAGVSAALTGSPGSFYLTWGQKKDRLFFMKDFKEIVSVTTHERTYQNMMVTMIDPIYDTAMNHDAFLANVTLSEIKQRQTGLLGLIEAAKLAASGL